MRTLGRGSVTEAGRPPCLAHPTRCAAPHHTDNNQVHIPTVRVTSQKRIRGTDDQETVTEDRSRGFGFVQFLCPRDAARVVKVRKKMSLSCFDALGEQHGLFVFLFVCLFVFGDFGTEA